MNSDAQEPETPPVRNWRARLRELLTHQAGPTSSWATTHTTPVSLVHQGVMLSMGERGGAVHLRMSLVEDRERVARAAVPIALADDPVRLGEVLDDLHADLRT